MQVAVSGCDTWIIELTINFFIACVEERKIAEGPLNVKSGARYPSHPSVTDVAWINIIEMSPIFDWC